jgi:hypothetical protein
LTFSRLSNDAKQWQNENRFIQYILHLCSMRLTFTVCIIFLSLFAVGQQKWETGINLNFNTSFIKPVASDTFTNKAGFGGGLMLERKFNAFALQLNVNYTQSRFSNDFANYTGISNAYDASLLATHPIDKRKQTVINYGFVTSYNWLYTERNLDGSMATIQNTLIVDQPLNYGLQLGLGLDLNPGTRLTINYLDFFNGKQKSGSISGQIDYLQFGLQLRINELLASKKTNNKYESQQKDLQTATQQVNDLRKGGNGFLVFILSTTEPESVGLFDPKSKDQRDSLKHARLVALNAAIEKHYSFGDYIVTTDTGYKIELGVIKPFANTQSEQFKIPSSKKTYYARIDELFLKNNGQLKWGIFVFDAEMNRLKAPFPFFTPYRQLDKTFEVGEYMIKAFNLSLNQYGTVLR